MQANLFDPLLDNVSRILIQSLHLTTSMTEEAREVVFGVSIEGFKFPPESIPNVSGSIRCVLTFANMFDDVSYLFIGVFVI